jgi:putative isomerase
VGLRHLDPALAGDQIKSMLAHVQEDGYLPHCVEPNGDLSKITQPPVLGWAAMKVYRTKPDREFLEYVYPRLRKFLEFFPEQRDRDGNGLCEWEDGDASGMDNSPRFDNGPEFDAIDLNCFLVREYEAMAEMAEALGGEPAKDADLWKQRAKEMSARINENLWDEGTGFYLDRRIGGDLVPLKTSCGFLPLFAGVATKERAARLVEHLKSEKEFCTPMPVPSVARDEEPYCKDMWRGPTWANYNYLIIEGLERYGYNDLAKKIAERTVDEIARWYLKDGVIFEIYDAEAEISPRKMPRKGKYGGSDWKNTVVRDYHWTAAVYVALALEKF